MCLQAWLIKFVFTQVQSMFVPYKIASYQTATKRLTYSYPSFHCCDMQYKSKSYCMMKIYTEQYHLISDKYPKLFLFSTTNEAKRGGNEEEGV